ncbi:MAG: alanine--glyoxylate aminotransferase family protein [Elusimicrobiales bacterium]|nr:alanine--glyoxylate aminotransferase family protein [Elusimicrobiales bacterium]
MTQAKPAKTRAALMLTPGPTLLPPAVLKALSRPLVHHRTPEFEKAFARLGAGLKQLFRTENPVYVLAASGTGAMQAAVCGLMPPGGRALVLSTGVFGDRWAEMLKRGGFDYELLRAKNGETVDLARAEEILKAKGREFDVVYFTHTETSTGVTNPAERIAALVRRHSAARAVLDAVSSLAIEPVQTDGWGLDCVVSASQKGLMNAPGLSFITLSQRAQLQAARARPPYYFDLPLIGRMCEKGQPAFTISSGLVFGQIAALDIIFREGLEKVWARSAKTAARARRLAGEAGLRLFAAEPANGLTVFHVPQGADAAQIVEKLREKFGIIIAQGQHELKGKILRVAHMGHIRGADVERAFGALKTLLQGT